MTRGGVGVLRDPLVPLDLGGWFKRVFGVMARDRRRFAAFTAIPAGAYVLGLVAIIVATPSEATLDRRIAMATRVAEAGGTEVDRSGVMWSTFGPFVAVVLAFVAVLFLVVALYLPGAFYLAARAANGQPSTLAQALGFARPRMLPLVGWYLLINVVVIVAGLMFMLPGLLVRAGGLVTAGVVVWLPILFAVTVVFGAVLLGVVVMERGGADRAFRLLRPRFWSTAGRLVVASLLYMVWGGVMNVAMMPFNTSIEAASFGFPVILAAIIQGALMVPALMFVAAVGLVTHAELRHREDRSVNTGTLAAQLAR